jgi:hypothetical protein
MSASRPSLAAVLAAEDPAGPAPTTITSYTPYLLISLLAEYLAAVEYDRISSIYAFILMINISFISKNFRSIASELYGILKEAISRRIIDGAV